MAPQAEGALTGPTGDPGSLLCVGLYCALCTEGGAGGPTLSHKYNNVVFSPETRFLRFIFNVDFLNKIYLRTYHPLEASFHFLQVKSKFVSYQKFPGVSEESHCLGPKETPGHNSGEDEGDKEDDDEGADEDEDESDDEDEEKR